MSTDTDTDTGTDQGTALPPTAPDASDGDGYADVLFLDTAAAPPPPRTAGTQATAGGPRRCHRRPVTSRTATSPRR